MNKTTLKRIQSFKKFIDKANESLNNIININFTIKNNIEWYGEFSTNKDKYYIHIKKIIYNKIVESDDVYTVKFGLIEGDIKIHKKLKTNSSLRSLSVFATVRESLKDFISKIKPNVLTFYASDKDDTRIKLYQNFCSEIIDKYKTTYYDFYHLYNDIPIFIICNYRYNILNIKDLYIDAYDFYKQ